MDVLHIEQLLYYQRHSWCGLWSCMRDPNEELQPHTLQAHTYITIWCATMHDSETHVAYACKQTTALLPMKHCFMRTNLASYSIHIAVSSSYSGHNR